MNKFKALTFFYFFIFNEVVEFKLTDFSSTVRRLQVQRLPLILTKVKLKRKPKAVPNSAAPKQTPREPAGEPAYVVDPDVATVRVHDKSVKVAAEFIVKQLSSGHTLMLLKRNRVRGFCVNCIRTIQDPAYKQRLDKVITYCSACPGMQWTCEKCFDEKHRVCANE